jgi:hypothetical protein
MPAGYTAFQAFTELVSTTMPQVSKTIADNVSKHNALYRRLVEKGNIEFVGGGHALRETLEYAQNPTVQWYSGYDPLNAGAVDVISSVEFVPRQAAVAISASGYELNVNSGGNAIVKLAAAKLKNARNSAANFMATAVYGDGTLTNSIGGLGLLVADTPANIVGGINASTYPFWQNKVQSAAAPIQGGSSVTVSATTIEGDYYNPFYLYLTRGTDSPDLLIASIDHFRYFEASQISIKRYTSAETAKGGFMNLRFKGADYIFDGDGIIPIAHTYFLNTDYIKMQVFKQANWTATEPRMSVNQDAQVTYLLWMGNMTCNNRSLQGVAKA